MPRQTILIVEDEAVIAMSLQLELEDEDYATLLATTIAAAREAVLVSRPDLVILDYHVGGGTTEAFARELSTLGVPFIVGSGTQESDLRPLFGDVPVFAKPFRTSELLDVIRSVLPIG